jgi:hypothetical protein
MTYSMLLHELKRDLLFLTRFSKLAKLLKRQVRLLQLLQKKQPLE